MGVFKNRQPVNSIIELPGKHYGQQYLSGGLRRVYSTGSWSESWRQWSKRHGSHDSNGSYLECVRPYHNGKQREYYVDMSMAHIDIDQLAIQPFDPVNTKYMNKHYLNGMSLRDLAHLPTNDFLRHIESLPCRGVKTRYGKGKRGVRH